MKTHSQHQADDLAAARDRLGRIHAEQARLAGAAPDSASVRDLVEVVKASKLNALLDPGPASKAQAAKAQAALDAAVQRRDEAEEGERLLAAEAVGAEIRRLEGVADLARVEAQRAKLRDRVARGAPAYQAFVKDFVALEGLNGNWLFEERLAEGALAACGASARQLLNDGKDLALGILAGKEHLP